MVVTQSSAFPKPLKITYNATYHMCCDNQGCYGAFCWTIPLEQTKAVNSAFYSYLVFFLLSVLNIITIISFDNLASLGLNNGYVGVCSAMLFWLLSFWDICWDLEVKSIRYIYNSLIVKIKGGDLNVPIKTNFCKICFVTSKQSYYETASKF